MDKIPLFSIITINYNNVNGLQKTIESVISQDFKDFEHIIIDGWSTDGSDKMIDKYSMYLNYSISEPDHGVYHAMNKGVKVANGNYLLFLNSGDILYNAQSLAELASNVQKKPNHDIYYANLLLSDSHNNIETLHRCPEKLTLSYLVMSFIGHPSSIIKRSIFNKMGGYIEHYHIISDWLFFVKAFLNGHSFQYINTTSAIFFLDGASSSGNSKHIEEIQSVYQNELSFIAEDIAILKKFKSRPHQVIDRILNSVRK